MKGCLRALVMSMTLAAATSMTATALADPDSAQAALDGISSSAASSSDTPAPDATAHHHHHHHEETPKAKDKDEAPAPSPATSTSAAPAANAQAAAPAISAAPITSAQAPAPVETAKPLQLRESHDAHPITLAPEPASGAMWKIGAILAVLGAIAWALKKSRAPKSEGAVKSLEVLRRLSIGVRTELIVVDVDGQRLLLGVTPNAIQTLASLPDPDAEAHAEIAATTSSHIGDRLAALVENSRASAHDSTPPPRVSQPAPRRVAAAASTRVSRKSAAALLGEGDAIEGQARGLVKIGHRQ